MSDGPDPWGRRPGRAPSRGRSRWWLWPALVLGVVALVAYLDWRFPDTLSSGRDWARVGYLVALLALVSSAVLLRRRPRPALLAKQAAAWLGLALVVLLGYSYRLELIAVGERLLGELLPHRGAAVAEGEISFRAGLDGHFRIEATVDGTPVRFLVDTGASLVVLSPADARRLGFDVATLAYTQSFATANGTVRAAPVRLGELVIGPVRVSDLAASVNGAAMESSLLGISFLARLRSYEVRGDTLTLRW